MNVLVEAVDLKGDFLPEHESKLLSPIRDYSANPLLDLTAEDIPLTGGGFVTRFLKKCSRPRQSRYLMQATV
jgi:hypothetical protein